MLLEDIVEINGTLVKFDTPDRDGNIMAKGCFGDMDDVIGIPILYDFDSTKPIGRVVSVDDLDGALVIKAAVDADMYADATSHAAGKRLFLAAGFTVDLETILSKPVVFDDCKLTSVAVTPNPMCYGTNFTLSD